MQLTAKVRHAIIRPPIGKMRLKLTTAVVVILAACAVGVNLVGCKQSSGAKVDLTLRISVDPAEQSGFVIQQAGSAKFKYLVGKMSGVKPVFAQRLSLKPVPNTALIEAQVGVTSQEEAKRYGEVFIQTLQSQCGTRARVALKEQSIR